MSGAKELRNINEDGPKKKKNWAFPAKEPGKGSLENQEAIDNCSIPVKYHRERKACPTPTSTSKGQMGNLDFHLHQL